MNEPLLDAEIIEIMLRDLVADLDYDLHKSLERDESTGEDKYPDLAADFVTEYEERVMGK